MNNAQNLFSQSASHQNKQTEKKLHTVELNDQRTVSIPAVALLNLGGVELAVFSVIQKLEEQYDARFGLQMSCRFLAHRCKHSPSGIAKALKRLVQKGIIHETMPYNKAKGFATCYSTNCKQLNGKWVRIERSVKEPDTNFNATGVSTGHKNTYDYCDNSSDCLSPQTNLLTSYIGPVVSSRLEEKVVVDNAEQTDCLNFQEEMHWEWKNSDWVKFGPCDEIATFADELGVIDLTADKYYEYKNSNMAVLLQVHTMEQIKQAVKNLCKDNQKNWTLWHFLYKLRCNDKNALVFMRDDYKTRLELVKSDPNSKDLVPNDETVKSKIEVKDQLTKDAEQINSFFNVNKAMKYSHPKDYFENLEQLKNWISLENYQKVRSITWDVFSEKIQAIDQRFVVEFIRKQLVIHEVDLSIDQNKIDEKFYQEQEIRYQEVCEKWRVDKEQGDQILKQTIANLSQVVESQ